MDIAAILALIGKGITVVEALYQAGQQAAPAITALKDLVTGAQQGTVTEDQLNQTEALLDQLIDEFNLEIA